MLLGSRATRFTCRITAAPRVFAWPWPIRIESRVSSSRMLRRTTMTWGKYESSFDSSEPESYRRDVRNAEVHIVDGGHFALDTAADEIAALIGQFMKTQK